MLCARKQVSKLSVLLAKKHSALIVQYVGRSINKVHIYWNWLLKYFGLHILGIFYLSNLVT